MCFLEDGCGDLDGILIPADSIRPDVCVQVVRLDNTIPGLFPFLRIICNPVRGDIELEFLDGKLSITASYI